MSTNGDVELDIQIDPHRLDEEWVGQPRMYFRYATRLADARQEWDQAKNDLEITKAELEQMVRDDPARYGMVKVTESAVAACIPTQKQFQMARDKVLQAKHRVDVYEAAVGALDHRKKALEKLVELFMANYYSTPRAPAGTQEEMREVERRSLRQGRKREE